MVQLLEVVLIFSHLPAIAIRAQALTVQRDGVQVLHDLMQLVTVPQPMDLLLSSSLQFDAVLMDPAEGINHQQIPSMFQDSNRKAPRLEVTHHLLELKAQQMELQPHPHRSMFPGTSGNKRFRCGYWTDDTGSPLARCERCRSIMVLLNARYRRLLLLTCNIRAQDT